jgi:hypothetical protein
MRSEICPVNYPLLKQGDQLPAVGVLQKLLNRTGETLVPDGVFGPHTLGTVRAFQSKHKLSPDGVVGTLTWQKLVSGVSLPILDSVDVFDSTFYREDATYIRQAGGNPLLIGGACNGVEQAVSQILNRGRELFLLRFHGHGLPGIASVSTGETAFDPKERSDISANPRIMKTLSQLRGVFGRYGCLEFIECSTGRGPKGRRLLSQIAASIGVPVTAALIDQPFGRAAAFRLIGPTHTAFPGGGSLSTWSKSLPNFPA